MYIRVKCMFNNGKKMMLTVCVAYNGIGASMIINSLCNKGGSEVWSDHNAILGANRTKSVALRKNWRVATVR